MCLCVTVSTAGFAVHTKDKLKTHTLTERSVWTVCRRNLIKHTRWPTHTFISPETALLLLLLLPPSITFILITRNNSTAQTQMNWFVSTFEQFEAQAEEPFFHLLSLPCRAETICRAWIKINFSPWWKDAASRLLAARGTADKSCLLWGAVGKKRVLLYEKTKQNKAAQCPPPFVFCFIIVFACQSETLRNTEVGFAFVFRVTEQRRRDSRKWTPSRGFIRSDTFLNRDRCLCWRSLTHKSFQ